MNPLEWLGDRLAYQLEGIGIPTLAQAAARLDALERGEPISQQEGLRSPRMTPDEMMGEMMPGGGMALRTARLRGRPRGAIPNRPTWPEVYRDPREMVEESAERVAPESPLLQELFGVTRADLDSMMRGREALDDEVVVPVQGQRKVPERVLQLRSPQNEQRVRDVLEIARETPEFTGSYGWYENAPLLERAVGLLGPEEARRWFDQFHQIGAALSPNSDVAQELRRASLAQYALRSGDPAAFTDKARLPPGYGHIAHTSAHTPAFERMVRGEHFANPDPAAAHKTKHYYESRMGRQRRYPTQDAHFGRGIGLADVRTLPKSLQGPDADPEDIRKYLGANPGGPETPGIREWYYDRIARPLGMTGSPSQALQWNALGTSTGVETDLGAPFLELLALAAQNQGARTGETAASALDRFIMGEGLLY